MYAGTRRYERAEAKRLEAGEAARFTDAFLSDAARAASDVYEAASARSANRSDASARAAELVLRVLRCAWEENAARGNTNTAALGSVAGDGVRTNVSNVSNDHHPGGGPRLAAAVWSAFGAATRHFVAASVCRKVLLRCVPASTGGASTHGGSHGSSSSLGGEYWSSSDGSNAASFAVGARFFPPGSVGAATRCLRFLRAATRNADGSGRAFEGAAETFAKLAPALVEALHPPPDPPDPRRRAALVGHHAAPPSVRVEAYAYLSALVDAAPEFVESGGGNTFSGGNLSSETTTHGNYLREGPAPVPDAVVARVARCVIAHAVDAAAREVAGACGHGGVRAAFAAAAETRKRRVIRGDGEKKTDENRSATGSDRVREGPFDAGSGETASFSVVSTRSTLRRALGAPPDAGVVDEAFGRVRRGDAATDDDGRPRGNRTHSAPPGNALKKPGNSHHAKQPGNHYPNSAAERVDSSSDAPVGKDADAARAALSFLASYARVAFASSGAPEEPSSNPGSSARFFRSAILEPLAAALRCPPGASASVCGALAASAGPLWAATPGAGDPPESSGSVAAAANEARHRSVPGGTVITKRPSLPKTPWPAHAPEPTPFSDLKALGGSSEASAASVSIVGAVTSRDPPAGTKRLENPKTKRAYEMLFLTLADHRGGRVRAQLIGKKAAKCAEAIEAAQRASGEKRVVVGLVGVKARRPKAPSDAPAVWDPKEESELILRPDHPSAEKL